MTSFSRTSIPRRFPARIFSAGLVLTALIAGFLIDAPRNAGGAADGGEGKIRVLLIDGQNNHDWARTTEELVAALDAAGCFVVTVTTSPEPEEWDKWTIDFSQYDVVLNNYYGKPWPKPIADDLLDYIRRGGGMVNVHAANNAFPNWPEYNDMTGLLWRKPIFGVRLTVDDETGKVVRTPRGKGPGAGHGRKHDFVVKVRKPDHPIMKGIPAKWLHAFDELYHGQRGPATNLTLLSSAFSSKESGGTGAHEPATWIVDYGRGHVVTTILGHLWRGQEERDALRCVGFRTILTRSLQWAAGRDVTIPVPENFPTKDQRSLAGS